MITIDARALREPKPTGVTEVAQQFIKQTQALFSDTVLFTGVGHISSTLTNFSLLTHLTTIERCAGVYNTPSVVLLPNTHFVHTEPNNPRVHVVHDLSFAHAPQWYGPRMRAWHVLTQATASISKADCVIAVSDDTKKDVMDICGVAEEKIFVVNPTTPKPLSGTRPINLPFKEKPFFLFIGTLEKRKNILGVVEAFKKLSSKPEFSEYHLVLAGKSGFGAPTPRDLNEKIHHLSYVTPEEKWWLLKHATALVYPSFFEGFGIPALEAAAVGCPTIISDCTPASSVMGDASIQVSPFDISQITLAMEAVATEKNLRSKLKTLGFDRAAWYSSERQRTALRGALSYATHLL